MVQMHAEDVQEVLQSGMAVSAISADLTISPLHKAMVLQVAHSITISVVLDMTSEQGCRHDGEGGKGFITRLPVLLLTRGVTIAMAAAISPAASPCEQQLWTPGDVLPTLLQLLPNTSYVLSRGWSAPIAATLAWPRAWTIAWLVLL